METQKNKLWKQETPVDQLVAVQMAIDGHFLNFVSGITSKAQFAVHITPLFNQVRELIPYLRGDKPW